MTQAVPQEAAGSAVSRAPVYNAQRIALVLVDHGSRFQAANDMLVDVAKLVRDLSGMERVYHAHMELAEPTIRQAFEAAVRDGATTVIYHPYFLSPGRHSMSDIPRMVAEAAQEFPGIAYCVTEPLGVHAKIGEVVLERAGLLAPRTGPAGGEGER
jgi:sirohydrochlorin ferrochelatase